MRVFPDDPAWRSALAARRWQRLLGRVSGVFLALALATLFDGLLAQMRTGANELELLRGQALAISGPSALKNPLNSDVLARFTPPEAPLTFELEGFFTGYWFGGGMWRGQVRALPDAEPGVYALRVSFKGAAAQSAQKYVLRVYADARGMREASHSFFRRFLDLNPFIAAACCGAAGILLGIFTYWFGRRYAIFLSALGLAEIYRTSGADGRLWCLSPAALAPKAGCRLMVLDANARPVGEASVESWLKGKLALVMPDGRGVKPGFLVRLAPPESGQTSNIMPD